MTASVIIPTFNGATHLPNTIPAVLRMDGVAEWIWVDDGSSDATAQIVTSLTQTTAAARLLRHPANRGRAAARNTGAAAATGDILVFLDADARPHSGYLAAHRQALEQSRAVASVGRICPADLVLGEPYSEYLRAFPRGPREGSVATPWRHFVTCSACIRADVFGQIGGFDSEIGYGEDADLASRLAASGIGELIAAPDAVIDLFGTETLRGAMSKTYLFGRSLRQIEVKTPGALRMLGLERLRSPIVRTLAGARVVGAAVERALDRLPMAAIPVGVRYLLAHALARGYADAGHGLPSNASWHDAGVGGGHRRSAQP